jgi:hypothetical protein
MSLSRLSLAVVSSLALAACGGGGGSPGGNAPGTAPTLFAVGASALLGSGTVWSSGGVDSAPGSIFVGENHNQARLFLTFYLGAIQSREVVSCTLRLPIEQILGDPLAAPMLGFFAERVDIGASLDAGDWLLTPQGTRSAMGPTVAPGQTGGTFEMDVAPALREALAAGLDTVTFRLRQAGPSDGDGFPDGYRFRVADPVVLALNPTLLVTLR